MKHPLIHIKIDIIKKTINNIYWQRKKSLHTIGENVNWDHKNSVEFYKNYKSKTFMWFRDSTSRYLSKKHKSNVLKRCVQLFKCNIISNKIWKLLKCQSINKEKVHNKILLSHT